MKVAVVVLCTLALVGCASSSGVHQAGPNLFTVTATASHGAGGSAKTRASAYGDAAKKCGETGKTVQVVTEKVKEPSWNDGMHAMDLAFRCV